jgi:hypothetical protein
MLQADLFDELRLEFDEAAYLLWRNCAAEGFVSGI